jgi:hypothetical protein
MPLQGSEAENIPIRLNTGSMAEPSRARFRPARTHHIYRFRLIQRVRFPSTEFQQPEDFTLMHTLGISPTPMTF